MARAAAARAAVATLPRNAFAKSEMCQWVRVRILPTPTAKGLRQAAGNGSRGQKSTNQPKIAVWAVDRIRQKGALLDPCDGFTFRDEGLLRGGSTD